MLLLARSLRTASSLTSAASSSSSALLRPAAAAAVQQQQRSYAVPAPADPAAFLASIARPPTRPDLSGDANVVAALSGGKEGKAKAGEPKAVDTLALKKAGVQIAMRRYVLWALSKVAEGASPADFPAPKPKKIIRGWGPRVQKGYRVRGRKRQGER